MARRGKRRNASLSRLRRRPRSRWRTGPATSPSTATRATTARRASTDSTSRSSGGTRTVGGEGGGTAATRTESRATHTRSAAAARSRFRRTRTRTRTRTTRRRSNRSKATARGAFSWMPPATISTMPTASTSKTKRRRAYARERRVLEIRRIFQRLFFQRLVRLARGDFPARRRAKQTRLDAWAGREGGTSRRVEPLRSEPRQTTDDEFLLRRRRRPHLGSLGERRSAAGVIFDARRVRRRATPRRARFKRALESGPDARLSASDRVRVAARLPRARQLRERDLAASGHVPRGPRRVDARRGGVRAGEPRDRAVLAKRGGVSCGDAAARVPGRGGHRGHRYGHRYGSRTCLRARRVRALEASWELLFVAARVWRSAEKEGARRRAPIPDIGGSRNVFGDWTGRTFGARRPDSLGGARVARGFGTPRGIAPGGQRRRRERAAAARVAALARARGRGAARRRRPPRELWRRVACAGARRRGEPGRRRRRRQKMKTARARNPGEYPATRRARRRRRRRGGGAIDPVRRRDVRGRARADQARASAASPFHLRFRVPCCEIPPPSSARAWRGGGPRARWFRRPARLRVGAGRARRARQRRVRRARLPPRPREGALGGGVPEERTPPDDEARRDEAAKAETNADAETKAFAKKKAFGGGDVSWDARARAAVRHRAAAHARLVGACLARDMPDQAGACLRQMRAALAPGRCPAADPADPRAAPARAVRAPRRRRPGARGAVGEEAFAATRGADVLAREGEAVIDALAAAASASETSTTRVFGTRGLQARRARWRRRAPRRRQPRRPCSRRSWRPARSLRARRRRRRGSARSSRGRRPDARRSVRSRRARRASLRCARRRDLRKGIARKEKGLVAFARLRACALAPAAHRPAAWPARARRRRARAFGAPEPRSRPRSPRGRRARARTARRACRPPRRRRGGAAGGVPGLNEGRRRRRAEHARRGGGQAAARERTRAAERRAYRWSSRSPPGVPFGNVPDRSAIDLSVRVDGSRVAHLARAPGARRRRARGRAHRGGGAFDGSGRAP